MDTLAVFRSRSEALKIYNLLKQNRIACITVSTPMSLGIGCGISVVFNNSVKTIVKNLIDNNHIGTFVGFFSK